MELKYYNSKEALYDCYMYFINGQTALKTYRKFKKILILLLGVFISLSILLFNWRTVEVNDGFTPENILYISMPIVIAVIIIVVSSLLSGVINRENFEDIAKNSILENEEITLRIEDKGITYLTEDKQKFYKSVVEENDNIYILLNYDGAIVITNEAFNEDVDFSKKDLIEEIKKHINIK